jgi:hypothetical protein
LPKCLESKDPQEILMTMLDQSENDDACADGIKGSNDDALLGTNSSGAFLTQAKETDDHLESVNNGKPKAIEYKTHFSYGFDDDNTIKTDDLEHLEPKLRDAWIEMRKLDKILKRATERERRVKMETQELIKKNRYELELLKMTCDRKEPKNEQENTANYMALSEMEQNLSTSTNENGREDHLHTWTFGHLCWFQFKLKPRS